MNRPRSIKKITTNKEEITKYKIIRELSNSIISKIRAENSDFFKISEEDKIKSLNFIIMLINKILG